MILINRESASHWYLPDGTPYHEVVRADGNGMRPVTLRDARKSNAYPSVTNILGVLAKPGLDAWKQEQAILAALTLPKQDDEPIDAFARRVVQDMSVQVRSAADLGSTVHAAIEVYLQTGELPENPDILRLFDPVRLWIDEEIDRVALVEAVAVHSEFGFAGRIDLVAKLKCSGTWAVIDFKTQKMKPDKKGIYQASFYETWPLQLMAYFQALKHMGECSRKLEDLCSVVINSVEPTPVQVLVWPREEHTAYWQAFQSARELWCFTKDYRPQSLPETAQAA
ncbi:MAG: PD-(D/E)XK nuclease family protein [Verrucomicrobiaceae bacterium]|nr:PD-(D/E)XK nuclease family protein [Verrucomicrobiaceae bacterium]